MLTKMTSSLSKEADQENQWNSVDISS